MLEALRAENSTNLKHVQIVQAVQSLRSVQVVEDTGFDAQRSFKSFPVQRDEHLITVLRYISQNPVRAGLTAD